MISILNVATGCHSPLTLDPWLCVAAFRRVCLIFFCYIYLVYIIHTFQINSIDFCIFQKKMAQCPLYHLLKYNIIYSFFFCSLLQLSKLLLQAASTAYTGRCLLYLRSSQTCFHLSFYYYHLPIYRCRLFRSYT